MSLPTWVVAIGRDLIRGLGGYAQPPAVPVQAPPVVGPSQLSGQPVGVGGNNAAGGKP